LHNVLLVALILRHMH